MAETLFDSVRARLLSLIPRFDLESSANIILESYGLICGESLSLPVGDQRPEMCRINRDGTAIQFSLALGHSGALALQFLGEAGPPGINGAMRIARNLGAIRAVTCLIGATDELDRIFRLLQQMTARSSVLEEDGSGIYWIGVSFAPAKAPALTVYINSRLGSEPDSWERSHAFTDFFGGLDTWRRIAPELRGRMAPLGMAVTISAGRPTTGRIYFSAYGLTFDYYKSLLMKTCEDAACGDVYDRYTEAMIGEDLQYPARSAVYSIEFGPARSPSVKFELCAHCAYSSDAEAAARCEGWLDNEGFDAGLYRDTIQLLTSGRRLNRDTLPELHAYVGLGLRGGETYSAIYLNPGPVLAG